MTSLETCALSFDLFGLVHIWFVSRQGLMKRDVQSILLLNVLCSVFLQSSGKVKCIQNKMSLFVCGFD